MFLSAIWALILPACPHWPPVEPHALLVPVKPGKSREIVANETAILVRRSRQDQRAAGISQAMRYDFF
jgi:hypothetical protein